MDGFAPINHNGAFFYLKKTKFNWLLLLIGAIDWWINGVDMGCKCVTFVMGA